MLFQWFPPWSTAQSFKGRPEYRRSVCDLRTDNKKQWNYEESTNQLLNQAHGVEIHK